MIERHWRGLAVTEQADAYVRHLRDATFPALQALPGFVNAAILRRPLPEGVEFLVITRWTSLAAIHAFAGGDPTLAVVPPAAAALMVECDARARHYEVVVG